MFLIPTDDREMDRLSNLSLGSNVFINTATIEVSSFPPKVQKSSPSLTKSSGLGPPDLLHRGDVVGQKLAEADRSESPVSMEKNRMMPTGRAVPCEIPATMSNATFSTPALTRRVRLNMFADIFLQISVACFRYSHVS